MTNGDGNNDGYVFGPDINLRESLQGTQGKFLFKKDYIKDLSEAIDTPSQLRSDLTAVPSPWARPILFAEAFSESKHPLHNEIVNEWRGFMGLFCFSEVLEKDIGGKLWISPASLAMKAKSEASENFYEALEMFRPGFMDNIRLFKIVKKFDEDGNPVKEKSVTIACTSPKTLIFTAPSYRLSNKIPWYDSKREKLFDPVKGLLENKKGDTQLASIADLKHWIECILAGIPKQDAGDMKDTWRTPIKKAFEKWLDEIKEKIKENKYKGDWKFKVCDKPDGDSLSFHIPAFSHIRPLRNKTDQSKISSYFLLETENKLNGPVIVLWEEMEKEHAEKEIHDGFKVKDIDFKSCGHVTGERIFFKNNKSLECRYIRFDKLFTNRYFYFNLNRDTTINHEFYDVVAPETGDHQTKNLPYALPLKSNVLEYFDIEQLKKIFRLKVEITGADKYKLTPVFNIEIRGADSSGKKSVEVFVKGAENEVPINAKYLDDETKAFDYSSILNVSKNLMSIWPGFKAQNWKLYYLMYAADKDVQGFIPEALDGEGRDLVDEKHETDVEKAVYSWSDRGVARMDEWPAAIRYSKKQDPEQSGLVLLKEPVTVDAKPATEKVQVAIDFGTSNTTVCVKAFSGNDPHGNIDVLEFQDQYAHIIQKPDEKLELENFKTYYSMQLIPPINVDNTFPSFMKLHTQEHKASLLHSNIIFSARTIDKLNDFKGRIDFESNLKWDAYAVVNKSNTDSSAESPKSVVKNKFQLYIEQLLLQVCVELASQGYEEVEEIFWSYPESFSEGHPENMLAAWRETAEEIERLTGFRKLNIKHPFDAVWNESYAACVYAIDKKVPAILPNRYALIMDIGGGSTDIAVWHDGNMELRLSVPIGGGIISSYPFDKSLFKSILQRSDPGPDASKNKKAENDVPEELLNSYKTAYENKPFALWNLLTNNIPNKLKNVFVPENPAARKARTYILYYFGAIFYYLGHFFRQEEINNAKVTPFLAGNGSQMLKWITADDVVLKKIFSKLMKYGTLQKLVNSEERKKEVAKGLLSDLTHELCDETTMKLYYGVSGCSINEMQIGKEKLLDEQPSEIKAIAFNDDFPELFEYFALFNEVVCEYGDLNLLSINYDELHDSNTEIGDSLRLRIDMGIINMLNRKEQVRSLEPVQPLFMLQVINAMRSFNADDGKYEIYFEELFNIGDCADPGDA